MNRQEPDGVAEVVRSEERLRVGTVRNPVERVRLSRRIVTELRQVEVAIRREELVDGFDPSVIETHVAAADYVERRCSRFASEGKGFWFWSKRSQSKFTSDEFKRLEEKRTARFKPLPPPVRPCDHAMHAW